MSSKMHMLDMFLLLRISFASLVDE